MIDPRKTKWIGYWDMATVVALLFVALVTPFEVAFLDSPRDWNDVARRFGSVGWLFTVNRCVDGLFIVDLVLQFRLMYTEVDSAFGTQWVTNPTRIIRHYLKTWFLLDAVSIAVAVFDIIPLFGTGREPRVAQGAARDARITAHQAVAAPTRVAHLPAMGDDLGDQLLALEPLPRHLSSLLHLRTSLHVYGASSSHSQRSR